MEYTKEYLSRMKDHLNNTRQAWCFDEFGKVWTRETISKAMLTAKSPFIYEVTK